MVETEPPDSINLPTMNLLEAKKLYENILSWTIGFRKNNSEINDINKLEYGGLRSRLKEFYESAKVTSKLDPRDFLFGDRRDIYERRAFSKIIIPELKRYLNTIESMVNPGMEEYEPNEKEPTFKQPDHFSFNPPKEYEPGSGDYEFPESK